MYNRNEQTERQSVAKRSKLEIEILENFGLNPDLTAISTTEIRTEKRKPNKRKRRRLTTWMDLPSELQTRITQNLKLLDLYSAFLGGLFIPRYYKAKKEESTIFELSLGDESDEKEQTLFQKQVEQLQPLRDAWLRSSQSGRRSTKSLLLTPIEFANLKQLHIKNASQSSLSSINQLRHLRILDISRTSSSSIIITDLPTALKQCTFIYKLYLSKCSFHSLPKCILSLSRLNVLDLSYCTNLSSLPRKMGIKLCKLASLNIVDCPLIKELPLSVLKSIERNSAIQDKRKKIRKIRKNRFKINNNSFKNEDILKLEDDLMPQNGLVPSTNDDDENEKVDVVTVPLMLSERYFEQDYLKSVFDGGKFPYIVNGLKNIGHASFLAELQHNI